MKLLIFFMQNHMIISVGHCQMTIKLSGYWSCKSSFLCILNDFFEMHIYFVIYNLPLTSILAIASNHPEPVLDTYRWNLFP